ncbi:MAG: hypothetical protein GY816_00260 [Cytophagales bacterium]|nr:hypothetical protein [Cytophagales bacterium]
MNRAGIVIAILLVVLISVMAIHNALQPKPFRWDQSLKTYDKQPYGTSVVYAQLENLFPDQEVKKASSDLFVVYYDPNYSLDYDTSNFQYDWSDSVEYEDDYYIEKEEETATIWSTDDLDYLYELLPDEKLEFNFIGVDKFLVINEDDSRALLQHIYQGNHALIASQDVQGILLNELEIYVNTIYSESLNYYQGDHEKPDSLDALHFTVKFFDNDWVSLKPTHEMSSIKDYPEGARVIAKNKKGDVIGIELSIGKGTLTFVSNPLVFTNYTVLKTDASISEQLLTNLPNLDTHWANGQWSNAWNRDPDDDTSLLAFILSEESLKWAFFTLLFAVLTFFLFEIKRQQRAIPVIAQPENVSLRFTETISRLYQIQKDNREIVRKKMRFLLEHIRNDLNLDTRVLDDKFHHRLALKSKVDETIVRQMFIQYHALKDKNDVTDEEFLRFNRLVQNFKKIKK